MEPLTPVGALAIALAGVSAILQLYYLVRRPKLTAMVRLGLLFGLAVFPFGAAVATTASGMHRTTEPTFCGSCHVMDTHYQDLVSPTSTGLAARHSRSPVIGPTACYTCHADYGMLGYPLTKITGMMHVYHYYLGGYRNWPLDKFHAEIRTAKPYPNQNCKQCHSGTLASFTNVKDHLGVLDELEKNTVSCASAGCHGVAHPFTKRPEELK